MSYCSLRMLSGRKRTPQSGDKGKGKKTKLQVTQKDGGSGKRQDQPCFSSSLQSKHSRENNDIDDNPAKTTLQTCFAYLRKNLPIDNDLAAQLFEWKPQLLDEPTFHEIRALNGNGKHSEAFQKWYQFAESYYTKKRLKVFCECLEELEKDTKPMLIEVAQGIRKLLRESLDTHDIPGPVGRPQGTMQKTQLSDMSTIGDEDLSMELKGSPELLTEDRNGPPDERCLSVTEGSVEETVRESVEDTQSSNSSKPGGSRKRQDQPCFSSSLQSKCSRENNDIDENTVKTTLQSGYAYLRGNLPIDNELAAKLFGWKPQLLDRPSKDEIGALNVNGKHSEAFEKWYQFAESWYTEKRLKDFCECLEELGKGAKPKLIEVAKEIRKLLRESPSTHDIPGSVDRSQRNTQKYTSELCMKYKTYLGEYYRQMKTVEDTWLIQNNKQLTYIQLRLLEAEENCDIKDSCSKSLGSHDTYSSLTRESNRYVSISTRDILSYNPGEQDRKIVLLEGAPGSGKSTTARYLCKEYAAGRMLQEYELLIMVYLRLLPRAGCTSFSDLLAHPGYFQQLEKLAKEFSEGRGILFVLEGWDERPQNCSFLDSIIKGDELPASSVLITSRHAAAASLYQKVNRRIEIAPFSIEQKEDFISSYFHNDKKKSSLLIDHLSQRPHLSDLCMYPMVLSMACFVYQTDGLLPSTVTEMYLSFLFLASNRYLKERMKVRDRVSSIEDILNSPHFEDFRNMAKLALEGVRKNRFVFSDNDLQLFRINLSTNGYNLLLSCCELDARGVERCNHHYLHSSVQSCLAALELNLLDKEEQIKILQECTPDVSKKPYPPHWEQYLDQLPEGPYKQQQKGLTDCFLSDAEDATKDQRLLLYQFFAGITHLADQNISSKLMRFLLKENAAFHQSTLPIILYESRNEELTREVMTKTFSSHLTLPRCDNYLLLCTGWCLAQTGMKIEELTVNLSPNVQLHHFFNYYHHHCYLVYLYLRGSIASSDLSSVISVLERCLKLKNLSLIFSVSDSKGSAEGTLPSANRTASVVAALPDLYELTIGKYDAPLTDQFTAQVLTSITKSKIKVLNVLSSSPVLLQKALLYCNKMESLHSLELVHDTSQNDHVVFDEEKGRHMEDTLKATKLRKLSIVDFSSTTFGSQFISLVTQAVSQRQHKELMNIAYETIPSGSQEANNAIDICVQHPASSTALHCWVGDASHLEWMKPFRECLICFGPELTTKVYCLISCHGSQLRGYVSSVHAIKHLPGLLTLAKKNGIQTMSLSMKRKDLLNVSVLPAFNTATMSKEKRDIYNFLTFDGIMRLDDNEIKHFWNVDKECFEMCKSYRILQNHVPRTRDIWMVHADWSL